MKTRIGLTHPGWNTVVALASRVEVGCAVREEERGWGGGKEKE